MEIFGFVKGKISFKKKKSKPLPWMGNKTIPYKQNTFLELDDAWQIDYVRNSHKISQRKIK